MLVLGLVSCSSNEDSVQIEDDKSLSEIAERYENYKASTQGDIGVTYQTLTGEGSRSGGAISISGPELVSLLSSLPVETVDSLYMIS